MTRWDEYDKKLGNPWLTRSSSDPLSVTKNATIGHNSLSGRGAWTSTLPKA